MASILKIATDHLAGRGCAGDYPDSCRWAKAKLDELQKVHALFVETSAFAPEDEVMVTLESDIDTLVRAIALYERADTPTLEVPCVG